MMNYNPSSYVYYIPCQEVTNAINDNGRTTTSSSLPHDASTEDSTDTTLTAELITRLMNIPGCCYKSNNDIRFPLKGNADSIANTIALIHALNSTGLARIAWRGTGGHQTIFVLLFTEFNTDFNTDEDQEVP